MQTNYELSLGKKPTLQTNYELSLDQKSALELFDNFLESNKLFFLLEGYAGTGKTFIMKKFIEIIRKNKIPFTLCAPTHRAKMVLSESTGCEAETLHKLLLMSPNIAIFDLDYNFLKFKSGGLQEFPQNGIIIIDECSMITNNLLLLIKDYASQCNTKVIFVGDRAQLKGVGESTISSIFRIRNKAKLTTIHRQDENSDLLDVLFELRMNPIFDFSMYSDKKSLIQYNSVNAMNFINDAITDIKFGKDTDNLYYTKVISFTNDRVARINNLIRKIMFNDENRTNIFKGEILTGYCNIKYNNNKIFNSVDYRVISVKKSTKNVYGLFKLKGYDLQLYDPIYKVTIDLFMIDFNTPKDELKAIGVALERKRLQALEAKKLGKASGVIWKDYYRMYESFTCPFDIMLDNKCIKPKVFDFGYSSTIHKVQGVTLDKIYVDMRDVYLCRDKELLRQLQYVGLSRTKSTANIFIK